MKKNVSYVMRKKDSKYVITRYIFINGTLESTYWVNTYYTEKSAKDYFDIISDNIEYHNFKLNFYRICKNIWVINYGF